MPAVCRRHQRGGSLRVDGVRRGAAREQQARGVGTIRRRGGHQRRLAFRVGRADISAGGNQRLHDRGMTLTGGEHEGALAALIGRDVRPRGDERRDGRRVPVQCGDAQRGHVRAGRGIHIGAGVDRGADGCDVAGGRRLEQAIVRRRVRRRLHHERQGEDEHRKTTGHAGSSEPVLRRRVRCVKIPRCERGRTIVQGDRSTARRSVALLHGPAVSSAQERLRCSTTASSDRIDLHERPPLRAVTNHA